MTRADPAPKSLSIRERSELKEDLYLGPLAARSSQSRGRAFPEQPDSIRTAYARDRDRILHCKSFRRLKHKTQVFLATENDHYRTRLTHTLEVAQIGRTIARALELNEDLAEAISLGHDLGHTPFGHAGERALDGVLRLHQPDARFRHDEQSLRVVEVLENQGQGLNLTWEVLDGIGHHSKGRRGIASVELPATLEAQCVRIADRVAYLHHDIEDAVRAGFLLESQLPAEILSTFGERPGQRLTYVISDLIETSAGQAVLAFSPNTSRLLDVLKEFLFDNVYARERDKNLGVDVGAVIARLFNHSMVEPGFVPDWIRTVAEREYPASGRANLQAAVDYVAGMTDRYALSLYAML